MSLPETSCITPRPNCATGPETCRSVSTATRVAPPASRSDVVIVAAAVPEPRASRACARSTARCAARSASTIRTVPSNRLVTGPSLIVIAPSNVSPSPPESDAPGRHGRDALDVEQHREGLVRRARRR